MKDEYADRLRAIKLRLAGQSVAQIRRLLGRSKELFHKWWNRYLEFGPDGLFDLTRANHRVAQRIAPELERTILTIRRRLQARALPDTRYQLIGASEPPPGFPETPNLERIGVMNTTQKYSPEVRERAVRMVFEHQGEHESQWAAINSIATKIGCTGETLRKWVRQAERDQGKRPGLTSTERERLKELERENRELKRANEILRKAAAFFAQAELDRRPK